MKQSFILQHMRKVLLKRLLFPILLTALSLLLFHSVPLVDYFHPITLTQFDNYKNFYTEDNEYVTVNVETLYYSGFDYVCNGKIRGHYYYTLLNNFCRFYLIKGSANKLPSPTLEKQTISGSLINLDSTLFNDLIHNVAQELDWTVSGLKELSDPYIITTLEKDTWKHLFLFAMLIISLLYSVVDFAISLLFLLFPSLAPTFHSIVHLGPFKTTLSKIEQEITDFCLAKTKDMYLTSNFIINLESIKTTVIPLESIVWIYTHGRLHRILWIKLKLSYTLYLMTNNGKSYEFTNKELDEIECIMDTMKVYCPKTIYGYSKENKRAARKSSHVSH